MADDKTYSVTVWNVAGFEVDQEVLTAVMRQVHRILAGVGGSAEIYPSARVPADAPPYKFPGSLEWLMRIKFAGHPPQFLTIGCIQASPDAKVSFHS